MRINSTFSLPICFALLFLFGFSSRIEAQELEWSNVRKLKGTAVFTHIIGETDEGIYLLRYRNKFFSKQVILERYREKLGFALSRNVTLKKARLLSSEIVERDLLLFSAHYLREHSTNEVRLQRYNENLEPIGDMRTLCKSSLADYYDKGDFRIQFSHDKSKMLLCYTERSEAQTRILHIKILAVGQWEELQSKSIEIPMEFDAFSLKDLNFENGEDVFLVIGEKGRSFRKEMKPFVQSSLYHFNTRNGEMVDYLMNDSQIYVQQPQLSFNRALNLLHVTGLYGVDNPESFVGYYNMFYQLGKEAHVTSAITPFSDDLKSMLTSERSLLERNELKDLTILKVIPNSDGGLTIISEKSSVSSEEEILNVNGIPQAMARNIYNYDDLLIMALDSNGKGKWNYVINKNQSSMNDGGYFGSVVIGNTRSHIYIIYNDQMRSQGDVLQYTINNSGDVSYKILVRSDADYVSVIPRESKQIGYNKLLLPTNKDKRFALLKLVYPN
jgi:hypothetical protein